VARRSRFSPDVYWGCSDYPLDSYLTTFEPTGAVHDAHEGGLGAVGRRGTSGVCLRCGATVELPQGDVAGRRLPGGPPDPEALRRPSRRSPGAKRDGTLKTQSPKETRG
jgi:hypothetical protein